MEETTPGNVEPGRGAAGNARPGRIDDRALSTLLPARPSRGHKGSFGRLLVVAGSLDCAGAALLVCSAASRAGTGLVTLAVPISLQPVVAGRVPETVTLGLPERDPQTPGLVDAAAAIEILVARQHDALVVGPGLRSCAESAVLILDLLAGSGTPPSASGLPRTLAPAVVDAEAIRVLAATPGWSDRIRRELVLTPHVGEFSALVGAGSSDEQLRELVEDDTARATAARDAAIRWGQVVVLKGARTVAAAPDGEVAVCGHENPALATAGTGDVLAGTIGAFLAQGLSPWDAARLGVLLHANAGEAIRQRLGDSGLVASDLPLEIAHARHRLAKLAEQRRGPKIGFGAGA